METRKLQKNATGSFIITLPKDWIASAGATEGDLLRFDVSGNVLEISSNSRRPEKRAGADNREDAVALYISGFDVIDTAEKISDELIGVECSDGVARVMVNTNALSSEELIKRQHAMAYNLFVSAAKAALLDNASLREEISRMALEERKVHMLILRKAVVDKDGMSPVIFALSCELDGIVAVAEELSMCKIDDIESFEADFVAAKDALLGALDGQPKPIPAKSYAALSDAFRRIGKAAKLYGILGMNLRLPGRTP